MNKKIAVIGAGLSGIFAANWFSSKGFSVDVYDSGNGEFKHDAVLRFKDYSVPIILNCLCEKINVKKGYFCSNEFIEKPNILLNNMYSRKVTGELHERSIIKDDSGVRYIIKTKPKLNNNIEFRPNVGFSGCKKINGKIVYFFNNDFESYYDFIISTIPMPYMLDILGIKKSFEFKYKNKDIYVYNLKLETESTIYQTYYFTDFNTKVNRFSIHGKDVIIESIGEIDNDEIINLSDRIGIGSDYVFDLYGSKSLNSNNNVSRLKRIVKIDNVIRKKNILDITEKYNIFSFGRYSVWKPGLMLDDLISDIEKIYFMMKMNKEERKYESYIN